MQTPIELTAKTEQEAFDKVVAHLASMKDGRSAHRNVITNCMYESREGKQCAIGCMIERQEDRIRLDTQISSGVLALIEDGLITTSISPEFLSSLQYAHDAAGNWLDGKFIGWQQLNVVGWQFGVNTNSSRAMQDQTS